MAKAQHRWRPAAEPWYFGRPVTAAIFGGVGYVVYVTLVQATLTTPDTPDASAEQLAQTPSAIGYVIAFALGLREQTFRDLLGRVFDLLATAGGADVEPPSVPPDFTVKYDATQRGVQISWGYATDNVGVTVYHVYRDYRFIASVRPSTLRRPPTGSAAESQTPGARRRFLSWRSSATSHVGRPTMSREPNEPNGTTEEPNLLSFVDYSATDGLRFYAVTAADAADNESSPAGPIAVHVPPTELTEG